MSIENTGHRDPLTHLVGALGGQGMSGYIEDMEADGQRQLVASELLPRQAQPHYSDDDDLTGSDGWAALEAIGFRRGEDHDDLFCHAELPAGWTKRAADHAMWSHIYDERGVKRANVFYKAAFYDRKAHIGLVASPGADLASDAIYGDDEPALPAAWGVLTADERAEFVAELGDYRKRAVEHPRIYGDRIPRVDALEALAASAAGE
ncbi:hypothetical protein SEA_VANLEE_100 [Gordonia phage VanLee]|uniref:Uncharacterized protein n=1 Tax=Gordonia phage VanLee TaxID=2845816 RepID=A0A8F2IFI6_9CAUD|nr:hypothetical protein QEH49_gp100 [Gordonia phage VanLee]QWS68217.1 hypothetical protein SEA_VANLEE_100 [Gordonia phage VanLee]